MWEFWRGKLGSDKGRTSPRSARQAAIDKRVAIVNFKDLNLSVDDEIDSDNGEQDFSMAVELDATNKHAIIGSSSGDATSNTPGRPPRLLRGGAQRSKLVIVVVGLPGRGKTFLCNKLKCYLNWLGHETSHFNVGFYRRLQKADHEVQDASFFDNANKAGVEARARALHAALDDVLAYLASPTGQVAIFDATNSTVERRQLLIDTFHGKYQYMFIESICTDEQVLEQNYRYKMRFSPDYQGVDMEAALSDFKARIKKYEVVYETISDRRLHYIKLIDMVTGRGYMDVNRISGYIPGKIVFFLMQVCKAGMTAGASRKIWLTRHGESEWNQLGRIGGDSQLSARGQEYARLLPDVLESRIPPESASEDGSCVPVSVWTSTLRRTIATAEHLPYPKLRWKALDGIHAGVCDGMTYSEIAAKFPEDFEARKRDKLRYRYPSGESYLDVVQRLEPVIIEMEREREFVCIVAHQAVLRAIYGYFTATPLKDIPRLDIPLHTLIELQPRPDGTMIVQRTPVNVGGIPRSVSVSSSNVGSGGTGPVTHGTSDSDGGSPLAQTSSGQPFVAAPKDASSGSGSCLEANEPGRPPSDGAGGAAGHSSGGGGGEDCGVGEAGGGGSVGCSSSAGAVAGAAVALVPPEPALPVAPSSS